MALGALSAIDLGSYETVIVTFERVLSIEDATRERIMFVEA